MIFNYLNDFLEALISEPFHRKVKKRLFKRLQLNISYEEHAVYMGKAPDIMWSEIIYNKNLSLTVDEMVKINNEEKNSINNK